MIEIKLPGLMDGMTEATLTAWRKDEGEAVAAGEVIAEVEVDKSTIDLESPSPGTLARILVPAGAEKVPVGTVLALLSPAESLAPGSRRPQQFAAALPEPDPSAHPSRGDDRTVAPEVSVASPLVRSMARQTGLDLATIQGSGPDGAIRVSDIETALGLTTSTAPTQGSVPAATTPRPTNDTPFVEVRHSAMRRVVARRLVESKRDAPHFYLRVECAVDSLIQLRAELNARPGFPPLTINDFLVRAAVLALREVPAVNASWTEEAVRRYQQVDLAVAVAVEGGLVTPIVRDAGQASLDETAARLRDLIDRARSRSLRPEEYTGGTFTVSNLGMRGVEEIYPVINPPQAAILGIGEARERPVSRHGQVVSATTIHGTLAADHRVLDGTEAAAYLMAYKGLIEEPAILLR